MIADHADAVSPDGVCRVGDGWAVDLAELTGAGLACTGGAGERRVVTTADGRRSIAARGGPGWLATRTECGPLAVCDRAHIDVVAGLVDAAPTLLDGSKDVRTFGTCGVVRPDGSLAWASLSQDRLTARAHLYDVADGAVSHHTWLADQLVAATATYTVLTTHVNEAIQAALSQGGGLKMLDCHIWLGPMELELSWSSTPAPSMVDRVTLRLQSRETLKRAARAWYVHPDVAADQLDIYNTLRQGGAPLDEAVSLTGLVAATPA
jgi:hypothetical protein